ncbi:hypothetical protein LCGC14_0703880 [marine sediment metagenome]|uniref:GSCFA domain-containing protein n=2 Tax=root TaxID=1 RepID=A0A831VLX3_9FLAO|nr:GSCFA domain-containing protein [Pricia antarctica]
MKLQTEIPLDKAEHQIDYDSRLVVLGSCFAENMGKKFEYYKFQQLQNPFGILFHPLAIEKLLSKAVKKEWYCETDIFQLNGLWHCFDAHSNLSDISQKKLLEKLNTGLTSMRKHIDNATHSIITLGTAWVYRHTESDTIVANCHKVPQNEFSKELIPIPAIVKSLKRIVELVQSVNVDLQLIFTVSPVRHLKDGFVENQRSKAHLVAGMHQLLETSNFKSFASYFPSYELLMDELRDYRFYERDMVHPNQLAIDYIWEKFKQAWISNRAFKTMEEVERVQKGISHRPFNPDTEHHRSFQKVLDFKMSELKTQHPFMEF